ncbi:MAG: hypothetical protein ACXVBR_04975 [Flavisolibacter sp.]
MKKCIPLLQGFLPFLFVLFLAACQKQTETIASDNNNQTALRKTTIDKWRIKRITQYQPWSTVPVRIGEFVYNKQDDPVSITFNELDSDPAQTNWIFKYNQKHQLTEAMMSYVQSYLRWQKFEYDKKGVIYRDSTYIFVFLINGVPQLDRAYRSQNDYFYDSLGRVVRVENHQQDMSTHAFNYAYDANGNLVRPGVLYDDRVNPQRTNEVFMFVARDYSMNNTLTAQSYNEGGLPLSFRQEGRSATFLSTILNNADIEYERKNGK